MQKIVLITVFLPGVFSHTLIRHFEFLIHSLSSLVPSGASISHASDLAVLVFI